MNTAYLWSCGALSATYWVTVGFISQASAWSVMFFTLGEPPCQNWNVQSLPTFRDMAHDHMLIGVIDYIIQR